MLDSKETGKKINRVQLRELEDLFDTEREKNSLFYDDAWVQSQVEKLITEEQFDILLVGMRLENKITNEKELYLRGTFRRLKQDLAAAKLAAEIAAAKVAAKIAAEEAAKKAAQKAADEAKRKRLEDLKKEENRLAMEAEKIKNSSPILNAVFKSANRVNQQNYRILILGATGSGKTSLLNLLANIGNVNEARDPTILN